MKARNDVGNAQSFNKHLSHPLEWQETETSSAAPALKILVDLKGGI